MATDSTPMRLLMVDDDETEALLMKHTLRDFDFEIETATSVASALSALEESAFDLILLDLSLPDASGVESLKAVRDHPGAGAIVVMTGYSDPDLGAKLRELGAQDYLIKDDLAGPELADAFKRAHDTYAPTSA